MYVCISTYEHILHYAYVYMYIHLYLWNHSVLRIHLSQIINIRVIDKYNLTCI